MGLQKTIARDLAKKYALSDRNREEIKVFNAAYDFRKKTKKHKSHFSLNDALDKLEYAVKNRKAWSTDVHIPRLPFMPNIPVVRDVHAVGHQHVLDLSSSDKYVIFSDHHYSYPGHRQDFFGQHNKDLYVNILQRYYGSGFTLVENGDVEELLILEPHDHPDLRDIFKDREKLLKNSDFADLKSNRMTLRRQQLERIVEEESNQKLFDALKAFAKVNRYVKIAGNHDYDLQTPEFIDIYNRALSPYSIDNVYDYLLLGDKDNVHYAIMHGHQFDPVSNPVDAAIIGETVSESLSWAFEGADRNWSWEDQVHFWATGLLPFNNNLVTDEYNRANLGQMVGAFIDATGIENKLGINLTHSSEEGWETLFGHNIAWEYFENSDPDEAVNREVKALRKEDREFFKFRHLSELDIATRMHARFPDASTRPCLILGHTHEARSLSGLLLGESVIQCDWYMNSGAAGKFGNMVWGIEIADGKATLVAWYSTGSDIQRRVFESEVAASGGYSLQAK